MASAEGRHDVLLYPSERGIRLAEVPGSEDHHQIEGLEDPDRLAAVAVGVVGRDVAASDVIGACSGLERLKSWIVQAPRLSDEGFRRLLDGGDPGGS